MAEIKDVKLTIDENKPVVGRAIIRVVYRVRPTEHDVEHRQMYRELVEVIGDDSGPGEDGVSEKLSVAPLSNSLVSFASQGWATRIHTKDVPISVLNEDPHPIFRTDEIQAQVTLTPIPLQTLFGVSNVIKRDEPFNA